MFEHLFDPPVGLLEEPWFPQAATVDLEEKEKEYRVHVDMPGFAPDEIAVEVTDRSLLIRAHHDSPEADETDTEMEMRMAHRIDLPSCVEVGKVTATYTCGQLEVVLPRKEDLPRPVEVKT